VKRVIAYDILSDFFDVLTHQMDPALKTFSHLILQDVLLLAGQNDHYVPIKQFTDQILTLTNVRSLTARMFTSKETADTHYQIGNLGLAANVMLH